MNVTSVGKSQPQKRGNLLSSHPFLHFASFIFVERLLSQFETAAMSNKMLEVDTLPVDQDVVIILDQPKGPSDTSLIKQSITSGDLYRVQEIVSDEYLCIGDLKKLTSCLALATEKNQVAIVSFLLQVGVPYSINQVRIAVDNCSIEIIDLFLAHDYNINEAIDWATPPLLWLAALNHSYETTKIIS